MTLSSGSGRLQPPRQTTYQAQTQMRAQRALHAMRVENRQALLASAMINLSDRERDILARRRLKDEPDTLEDLSQIYNISRERVRQIEVRAFEKLQEKMTA